MKKLRNLLSCTLVSALLMTTLVPCFAAPTGTSNGGGNIVLKTEDFLMMVVPVLSPESKDLKGKPGEEPYQPYVDKALEIGLLKPEKDEVLHNLTYSLTRELAVQIIDRSLTLKGETFTADKGLAYKFSDYSIINDINKEALLRTYKAGIVKGSKGKFNPKSYLTRADGAILVAKLKDKTLRDKIEVSANIKEYDPIAEFYIKEFEKGVPARMVVTERKKDGTLNRGDVDFTEKAFSFNGKTYNWWSDQAFEDRILGETTDFNKDYVNSMKGGVLGNMDYTQGDFFPHYGEVYFTMFDGIKTGKAKKMYDSPVNNVNRITYDLSKYASQMAFLRNEHAFVFSDSMSIKIALSDHHSLEFSSVPFVVTIYSEPKAERFKTGNKFSPNIGMLICEDRIQDFQPAIKQMFIRLYGEKTGLEILKQITIMVKGRDAQTVGKIYKKIDGIEIYMHDGDSTYPIIELTVK